MRRLITRLLAAGILAASLAFGAAAPVIAQTNPFQAACRGQGSQSSVCTNSTNDPIAGPNGAIIRITSILAAVAGVVSVIFLILGGMKYITSGGDSSGVATAKQTIIAALIGVVIALLARPIVTYVISRI